MVTELLENDALRTSLKVIAFALIIGAGLIKYYSIKYSGLPKIMVLSGFVLAALLSYFHPPGRADQHFTAAFGVLAAGKLLEFAIAQIKRQRANSQSDKISLDYVRKKMPKG